MSDQEVHDPHLPALTLNEAEVFRAKVGACMRDIDPTAVIEGSFIHSTDGLRAGLDNLARKCGLLEQEHWDDLIAEHLATTYRRSGSGQVDKASLDALIDTPTWRLYDINEDLGFTCHYGRPFCADLNILITADLDDYVAIATDQVASNVDDIEDWFTRGRQGLVDHLSAENFAVDVVPGSSTQLYAAKSASMYTASMATIMKEALMEWLDLDPTGQGVIFATPFRHVLLFAVVAWPVDEEQVLATLEDMMSVAIPAYHQQPGPVSPNAMIWHDGIVLPLTEVDGTDVHVTLPQVGGF